MSARPQWICAQCGKAIGNDATGEYKHMKLPGRPRARWHLDCIEGDDAWPMNTEAKIALVESRGADRVRRTAARAVSP